MREVYEYDGDGYMSSAHLFFVRSLELGLVLGDGDLLAFRLYRYGVNILLMNIGQRCLLVDVRCVV